MARLSQNFQTYLLMTQEGEIYQAKTLQKLTASHHQGEVISLGNVYQTNQNTLALAVNDKYYLVNKTDKDDTNNLDFHSLVNQDKVQGDVKISKLDARVLEMANDFYKISDSLISEEDLGDYITTLFESITFETDTGRRLSGKELTEIASGTPSKRTSWQYDEVYHVKDKPNSLAVNINGIYHLATKQAN